jgi:hypothetical protein
VPGASQAGAWRTKHCILTTNYEPKSPSRRAGNQSDEKKRHCSRCPQVDTAFRDATRARQMPRIVAMAARDHGVIDGGIFGSRHLGQAPAVNRRKSSPARGLVRGIAARTPCISQNAAVWTRSSKTAGRESRAVSAVLPRQVNVAAAKPKTQPYIPGSAAIFSVGRRRLSTRMQRLIRNTHNGKTTKL